MHCSSLLFDITQRVLFPFEMVSEIGDQGYISAFSGSITFPGLAEYVNNAPIMLKLAFNDNVLLSFLMETDLLVSLELRNRKRFTGYWNNDVLFTKDSFRKVLFEYFHYYIHLEEFQLQRRLLEHQNSNELVFLYQDPCPMD